MDRLSILEAETKAVLVILQVYLPHKEIMEEMHKPQPALILLLVEVVVLEKRVIQMGQDMVEMELNHL